MDVLKSIICLILVKNKRILVCPLDWGLGHATRMIPLINCLLKYNFEVIIGADRLPLCLLRKEFPDLPWIRLPSATIKYPKNSLLALKILLLSPEIIFGIFKEHKALKKIIKSHDIDIVISDNRYGLWNKKIYSIFVTHQVMIKMPKWLKFLEYPVYLINKAIISKYDKCWIPDIGSGMRLSGDLAHKFRLPANAEFIGLLSRFSTNSSENNTTKKKFSYDILAILSGPEPQRTNLENIIIGQLKTADVKALIIRGKPDECDSPDISGNIRLIPHVPTEKMRNYILAANIVICRAGYSSIMDLIALNRKAILIPTPGQTEQEYLARYLKEKGVFMSVSQKELNLQKDLSCLGEYINKIALPKSDLNLLDNRIKEL